MGHDHTKRKFISRVHNLFLTITLQSPYHVIEPDISEHRTQRFCHSELPSRAHLRKCVEILQGSAQT
ncbi:hypothetical protein L3X38_030533 [Prunus dulcis]|uniref:Uncharacterized protein n=1 Tax=Prunus dulcis TaxID=3755 RepID=A0AAD4VBY5_PRUDU|nr:hypothetical protein L3X38_030533 [Prunus dulcis]